MAVTTLSKAEADLGWLEQFGALEGVAAIIAERRRQIEVKGYDDEHDQQHDPRQLAAMAVLRLPVYQNQVITHGNLAQAGALVAAAIDRTADG